MIFDKPISNGREHIAQEFLTALLEWETSDATELYPAGVSQSLVAAIAGEASTSKAQEAPPVVERERPANVPGAQAAVAVLLLDDEEVMA